MKTLVFMPKYSRRPICTLREGWVTTCSPRCAPLLRFLIGDFAPCRIQDFWARGPRINWFGANSHNMAFDFGRPFLGRRTYKLL